MKPDQKIFLESVFELYSIKHKKTQEGGFFYHRVLSYFIMDGGPLLNNEMLKAIGKIKEGLQELSAGAAFTQSRKVIRGKTDTLKRCREQKPHVSKDSPIFLLLGEKGLKELKPLVELMKGERTPDPIVGVSPIGRLRDFQSFQSSQPSQPVHRQLTTFPLMSQASLQQESQNLMTAYQTSQAKVRDLEQQNIIANSRILQMEQQLHSYQSENQVLKSQIALLQAGQQSSKNGQ